LVDAGLQILLAGGGEGGAGEEETEADGGNSSLHIRVLSTPLPLPARMVGFPISRGAANRRGNLSGTNPLRWPLGSARMGHPESAYNM
jgi:hypothetical protein